MYSTTISAIRKGKWLIDQSWAQAHADLIMRTMKGESVEWGYSAEKLDAKDARDAVPQRIKMMSDESEIFKASPYMTADRFPKNSIVMIDIIGPVLKYGDVCTYGSVDYNNLVAKFANSKNIAGIILNVDSPGGQADGTAMLANTIRQASKIKPVVGVVQDGIAASAAMWIIAACQEVYCTEATDQVGSIGAYTTIYDLDKYYEAQGLSIHTIYAPQSTDKNKDYRDALKGDYALVQADLKFLVNDFIKDITAFRGQRLKTDKEDPFTGKMYKAGEAFRIGLTDGTKSLEQVVTRVQNLISLRNQNMN